MDSKLPVFENIWLADDDGDDCELFTDVIKQILPLATVTIIPNGEVLMQKLKDERKPDCLFLDINMPLVDGLECLLQIRSQRCFRNLPVIVFSSSTQPNHIDTSYKYGANLFYTKPSSFTDLIGGLSSIFKMSWKDPGEKAAPKQFKPILSSDNKKLPE